MIEIHPVKSSDKLKELYLRSEIVFSDGFSAVLGVDGEQEKGYCLFEVKGNAIFIKDIYPKDDLSLFDGILRSALFSATFKGVSEAYFEDTAPVDIIDKMGFILDKSEKRLDINKIFSCSCQNKG